MPLLGNAQLEVIAPESMSDYRTRQLDYANAQWIGATPVRVIDRSRTIQSPTGAIDQLHETIVYLPSRLIAMEGGYVALSVGDYLRIRQDGETTDYRVLDWEDFGERLIGTPGDIKAIVERRGV